MDCIWLKVSPSFIKGIKIINILEDIKFEQYLQRVVLKLKLQEKELFTDEEKVKLQKIFKIDADSLNLVTKSVLYLYKRSIKYVFMPIDFRRDLKNIGLNDDKAEVIFKIWSSETKSSLNDLNTETSSNLHSTLNCMYKLNAELSSDVRKKYKIPKTYLSLQTGNEDNEIEFTQPELYSVFLQLESIQNELDGLM